MWTLQERKIFADTLWDSLLEQDDEDHAMEIIKAIEFNYVRIEQLKQQQASEKIMQTVLAVPVKLKRDSSEGNQMQTRKLHVQERIIMALIIAAALFVLWACSGCMQTIHGMALDVESSSRYVADHTKVDR